jgi:hypothetical protein
VVPPGFSVDGSGLSNPVTGSAEEIADFVLMLGSLGFGEVRCDLEPKSFEAVSAMEPVVELVHRG